MRTANTEQKPALQQVVGASLRGLLSASARIKIELLRERGPLAFGLKVTLLSMQRYIAPPKHRPLSGDKS